MKKNAKKIAIETLGCKVNQCDSVAIGESLMNNGYEVVSSGSKADVYIINTCIVTGKTESQSRNLIRRALRNNDRAQVIVTGCYPHKSPGDLLSISNRVHVIGNSEKKDILFFLQKILSSHTPVQAVTDISLEKSFSTPPTTRFFNRTRAFLKIQDGCNSACTYCVVPSVRGPSRSLPEKEVKNRLHVLVQSGYSEVVLTGIHLGAYGLDLNPSSNITGLLRSVEKDDRLNHSGIRLSSLEPTEFSDELIEYISKSKIVCHHAHIPLQSGDQQILQKMGRGYTPDFFKDRIQHLVSRIRNVNIGIDVIAGFPGETDEQFHKTVAFIRELPVGYLHVFPYSQRPGTAAASYPDHVPETIRKKRAAVLRQLSSQKKHDFYSSFINRDLPVIVEGTIDKETGLQKGLSGNYIPVLIDGEHECRGKRVMVRITDVHDTRVFGKVV